MWAAVTTLGESPAFKVIEGTWAELLFDSTIGNCNVTVLKFWFRTIVVLGGKIEFSWKGLTLRLPSTWCEVIAWPSFGMFLLQKKQGCLCLHAIWLECLHQATHTVDWCSATTLWPRFKVHAVTRECVCNPDICTYCIGQCFHVCVPQHHLASFVYHGVLLYGQQLWRQQGATTTGSLWAQDPWQWCFVIIGPNFFGIALPSGPWLSTGNMLQKPGMFKPNLHAVFLPCTLAHNPAGALKLK